MLKGINPILTPDLLKYLAEMGHGDELVIADGNFPAASMARNLVRLDGIGATEALDAILSVFPLDQYDVGNFLVMEVVPGDPVGGADGRPAIWTEFERVLDKWEPKAAIGSLERFTYYERAKKAYLVIATGETAQYANVILKKGVVKK